MSPGGASFTTLRLADDDGVGELVLNRPRRLNSLSPAMLEELIAAAHHFDTRAGVRVVIVRGEGRAFCAGADLGEMRSPSAGSGADSAGALDALDLGRRMAEAITGMRALTVAAIHGHCVGGGVVLAAACDLRVAARSATFSIPEVDLGIPLGWGGIPRLVRELGPAVTKELVLSCRSFDAAEAHSLRFVNSVVDDDELERTAGALGRKLAGQPAYALTQTKRHVNAVAEELASTARSSSDAQVLLGALQDAESQAIMSDYLRRHAS